MRSRLLTAFILAAALIAVVLYTSPPVVAVIMGIALLVGGWEWSGFLRVQWYWRAAYVLLLAALGVWGLRYTVQAERFVPLMEIALAWWVVAVLWIIWAPTRGARGAAALAGALSLVPTWIALVRIVAHWEHGAEWLLFVLALAFAADTGAFFAGRHLGRTPLAPLVSPNKTWEGVVGGMLLALGVAAGANAWFSLPASAFLPLCLAAASFSVIGDLTESMLKRHVHIKDSGRLFPGHGGVLDRIDSVTAATPVLALGLMWLGAGR
jgi:phosphatidate cytidylyltransferase